MKKLVYLLISIQLLSLIIFGCNYKKNNGNNIKPSRSFKNENFNTFVNKFYSDSVFQISRIIFPLESEKKAKREKKILNEKDINTEKISKYKYENHNKKNWFFLSDAYFKGDSIAIIDGVRYKRRFCKTNVYVEEKILYADDELVMIVVKFSLINNKWYLVDFQYGFADE